jgi:hypothetical protein
MFQIKVVEDRKSKRNMFRKLCCFEVVWKEHGNTRQAREDNIIRRRKAGNGRPEK